jgi:hypothetical protein
MAHRGGPTFLDPLPSPVFLASLPPAVAGNGLQDSFAFDDKNT